jgi:hypothetical protein
LPPIASTTSGKTDKQELLSQTHQIKIFEGLSVQPQDAYAMGMGVGEAEPHGKAAEEIQQLYMYTSKLLGMQARKEGGSEKARSARKRTA